MSMRGTGSRRAFHAQESILQKTARPLRSGQSQTRFPCPAGWFFNPLAWQLIYTIGLLTGVVMKDGRRLVAVRRWLQIPCGVVLLFGLAWMQWSAFGDRMYGFQIAAAQAGFSLYFISFEKTFLPLPRLIHCLALTYLLSSFGWIERASNSAIAAPFAMIGRQALPAFALGSVLVYAVQAIKVETGTNFGLDSLMIGGGIVAMLALAGARQFWPKDNPVKPDTANSGSGLSRLTAMRATE